MGVTKAHRLVLLGIVVGLAMGCTTTSPIAPSAPQGKLTIVTREYHTEVVLPEADIFVNETLAGRTDQLGELVVRVPLWLEITVDARKADYQRFVIASGILGGPERWTFYLQPIEANR
jgi:hypothetical protein